MNLELASEVIQLALDAATLAKAEGEGGCRRIGVSLALEHDEREAANDSEAEDPASDLLASTDSIAAVDVSITNIPHDTRLLGLGCANGATTPRLPAHSKQRVCR
jgi:hypothetical protein